MKSKCSERVRPIPYDEEDKEFLLNIGKKLNSLRMERKLTQCELAKLSGLHKNFICIIENGIQNPSLMCMWHIVKALDLTLSEFFEEI